MMKQKRSDERGAPKGKDFWDKLESASLLISGMIVGLIGIYATSIYNNRQINVRQVEVVEKFFDRLNSADPNIQGAALVAIASLDNEQLATDLAQQLVGGEGGKIALTQLAKSEDPEIAEQAKAGLHELLSRHDVSNAVFKIACIMDNSKRAGTGFMAEGVSGIITSLHVVIGCQSVHADNPETGIVVALEIEDVNIARDVAVLSSPKLQDLSIPGLTLAGGNGTFPELILGFPQDIDAAIATRVAPVRPNALSLRSILTRDGKAEIDKLGSPELDIEVYALEGNVNPGQSGAPILDTNKRVIAVLNGGQKETGISWGVPFLKDDLRRASELEADLDRLSEFHSYRY